MRYSSRFFLYAPIALLLSLAAAAALWWNISATSLNDRLVADNEREIMPGVRMHYASKSVNGFPFNLDTVLDGFELQIRMRTGPLVWRSEHFAIHALTYGPSQQIFEAAGTQTLDWTGSDGAHHHFSFVPGSLRASAVLHRGRLARFDLDLMAMNSPDLSAQRLQFHIRKAPDQDALEFVASGDGVHLGPDLRAGFADELKALTLQGDISQATSLQRLLAGQSDWRVAAECWRQQHGRMTLSASQIEWGRDRASGTGTLSLDEQHRLRGRVVTKITEQAGETFEFDQGYLTSSPHKFKLVVTPLY